MLAILMIVKTGSCQSKCEELEKTQATEIVNVSKGYVDYFNMKLYSILELLHHESTYTYGITKYLFIYSVHNSETSQFDEWFYLVNPKYKENNISDKMIQLLIPESSLNFK